MTGARADSAPVFRIGVIGDTHGFVSDPALEALRGVDAIVMPGDLGDGYVLDLLETIAPVTAVAGNNHYEVERTLPVVANTRLGGVRVVVAHRRTDIPAEAVADPETRVIAYGHTHVPAVEAVDGVMWVNPGSPTMPRGDAPPSVAIVTVRADGAVSAEAIALAR